MIFGHLPCEEMLYPQSPYHYRKKWDLLLEDLSLPKKAHLTPGGLKQR